MLDGRTIASLSAEYGISKTTVSNWVKSYHNECQTNDEAKSEREFLEGIRRLRLEKAVLEKENSFLKSNGILCEGNRLTGYRFIQTHGNEFGIRWLLNRIGIHPNAYYNYLRQTKAAYNKTQSRNLRRDKQHIP